MLLCGWCVSGVKRRRKYREKYRDFILQDNAVPFRQVVFTKRAAENMHIYKLVAIWLVRSWEKNEKR